MNKMMRIAFNLLSEKVKENLSQVMTNQETIKTLIKSPEVTEELKTVCRKNELLLAENINLISSQLHLSGSGKKRSGQNQVKSPKNELNLKQVNECFELTLAGVMLYSKDMNPGCDSRLPDQLDTFARQLGYYLETGSLYTQKQPV